MKVKVTFKIYSFFIRIRNDFQIEWFWNFGSKIKIKSQKPLHNRTFKKIVRAKFKRIKWSSALCVWRNNRTKATINLSQGRCSRNFRRGQKRVPKQSSEIIETGYLDARIFADVIRNGDSRTRENRSIARYILNCHVRRWQREGGPGTTLLCRSRRCKKKAVDFPSSTPRIFYPSNIAVVIQPHIERHIHLASRRGGRMQSRIVVRQDRMYERKCPSCIITVPCVFIYRAVCEQKT